MQLPDAALVPLQRALDALVGARVRSRDATAALGGRVVAVRITELGLALFFTNDGERLLVKGAHDGEPDATLAGTMPAFLAALAKPTHALPPGIAVEGDALLVRDLRALLGGLEFDWEERLSRLTGDAVAHGVGRMARRTGELFRYAGDRLTKDVAEYLREESRDLVSKGEVRGFLDGVDQVRSDVDRFAARCAALEQQAKGPR